jgi:hypothetical protein
VDNLKVFGVKDFLEMIFGNKKKLNPRAKEGMMAGIDETSHQTLPDQRK